MRRARALLPDTVQPESAALTGAALEVCSVEVGAFDVAPVVAVGDVTGAGIALVGGVGEGTTAVVGTGSEIGALDVAPIVLEDVAETVVPEVGLSPVSCRGLESDAALLGDGGSSLLGAPGPVSVAAVLVVAPVSGCCGFCTAAAKALAKAVAPSRDG